MRRTVFFIIMSFIAYGSIGQSYNRGGEIPKVQIGLSTGINNMVGLLGPHINLAITDNFLVEGGIGIGSWGTKSTINIQYHPDYFNGVFYKIGYSNSTGFNDFETELELENGNDANVVMNLNPVDNLNLTVGNSWKLGQKNRFYIEGGYSVCLTSNNDAYKIIDDEIELSSTSESVMDIMIPGGLVFGLGFAFGL